MSHREGSGSKWQKRKLLVLRSKNRSSVQAEEKKDLRSSVLLTVGYARATLDKYRKAVQDFCSWFADGGYEDFDDDYDKLDDYLVEYFTDMYESKLEDADALGGKSKAKNTLYGVKMFMPRAAPFLVTSERVLRNWNRLESSTSYPPLSRDLVCLLAVYLVRNGWEEYGIGTLLAFDCLLRVGELCSIQIEDVADVGDVRMGSSWDNMSM